MDAEEIEDLKNVLTQKMLLTTDKRMIELLTTTFNRLTNFEQIDNDLVEFLNYVAEHEHAEPYDKSQYDNIVKGLSANSIVIYFKSAELFRTYTGKEFVERFRCQIRADYRKTSEIYEIIDDNKPQKIIIIVDSRDENELSKIKSHIINYSKLQDLPIESSDLIVFDNKTSNTFEIVIKNYKVENSSEKKDFIDGLLEYIDLQEKTPEITNKMIKRSISDIPGTSMVLIPELKNILGPMGEEINGYLTHGNNVTINITVEQMNNVQGDMTINNYHSDDEEEIDFIEYLNNANLDWYEPGVTINYDELFQEYINNVGQITKCKFTKIYEGVLFKKGKRTKVGNKRIQQIEIL